MPLAPRAILMRSPSAETEPWAQHEPQYLLGGEDGRRSVWGVAVGRERTSGQARAGRSTRSVCGRLRAHCGMCWLRLIVQ